MLFTPDTDLSLRGTAALVNTGHAEPDGLADAAALDAFVATWRWTGDRTHDQQELDLVRELRPRLERLWHVDRDDAVVIVNDLLVQARALPRLVKHDEWDYHLHATSPAAPLADRIAVESAMAMIDVIRIDQFDRLRVCAAADCRNVLVDLSKNRSRRFCDLSCANRTNVAAFRARRAAR